jgi:hydroxymethylglutaryl-CoA lyase
VKSDRVKIVECPRDAWQGLGAKIPTAVKAGYLAKLIAAGFTHIDAVSFVSPTAVPQMSDSEDVLQILPPHAQVEIIGIVVNDKGAERAINTGKVQTLGFPYSISRVFLQRNQNQTPTESLETLEGIAGHAYDAGLGLVAYVSMAFGNPYGEPWRLDQVITACDHLAASGVLHISLADTVGLATAEQVSEVFAAAESAHPEIEFGVHLHARPDDVEDKIRAAYRAGCRRFDSAVGGLGGCPFAQDVLVGNIPTERLLPTLRAAGAKLPDLQVDNSVLRANEDIIRQFSPASMSNVG